MDFLPAEILADIFSYDGLSEITRQVCRRWRGIALPIWLRRLPLLPSDPFRDTGMLDYLKDLSPHDRLFVRALDITSQRDFDTSGGGNLFHVDVADLACVENVLLIQTLLGPRITDLSMTDDGWTPESLAHILQTCLLSTHHLTHFQIALHKTDSYSATDLLASLLQLYRRDSGRLKSLVLDLSQSLAENQWIAMAECIELQHFHLGLHRNSEPVLPEIFKLTFPRWTSLSSLYICQPRFLSAETLQCLYKSLPAPGQLQELRLIFEACQASLYEQEFIEMIHTMPNLQILEAHLDWTNRMMEHVALTLADLRELSITCSSIEFTCAEIQYMVWGQALEKINMRTSGRIWGGFLEAVRARSRRVRILVYGAMKWGGSVDEWE
ncbi:hypothetical protein BGX23_002583 [Mortierella sp. AD031]|nr:hypothetical protein BGX23_002583 [Mortierella sp. AD031]KAG0214575.1 hypothetical protein BGX33_001997 [Mortierella sp. NVP41]